jgi:hypothetical protein
LFVAGEIKFCLEPLLEAHGVEIAEFPGGPVDARWEIHLSEDSALAWQRQLDPRLDESFEHFKRVVFAVQRVLRLWMPYLYFHDVRNLSDRETAWPMLVFSAMRPIESRSRVRCAYDVLEPSRIHSSFRWAGRPLRSHLRLVRARLAVHGLGEIIRHYPNRDTTAILSWMRKMPRFFGRLVKAEAAVVDLFLRHSAACWSGEQATTQGLVLQLEKLLRRCFGSFSFSSLAPLLVQAGTWALARELGLPTAFTGTLTVSEPASGREQRYSTSISYANSRLRRPLL